MTALVPNPISGAQGPDQEEAEREALHLGFCAAGPGHHLLHHRACQHLPQNWCNGEAEERQNNGGFVVTRIW